MQADITFSREMQAQSVLQDALCEKKLSFVIVFSMGVGGCGR